MGTLVLLFAFFCILFCLASIIYYIFRKNPYKVKKLIRMIAGIVVCYLFLLLFFSLTSQSKILPKNQDKCFDDWCAAVTKIEKLDFNKNNTYAVTLKITNRAKARAQRPDHPSIYVVDTHGAIYTISSPDQLAYEKKFGTQRLITSQIAAESSYQTTVVFSLPKEKKGAVVITEGGFPTPLIIGDEESLFHKKSLTPLD